MAWPEPSDRQAVPLLVALFLLLAPALETGVGDRLAWLALASAAGLYAASVLLAVRERRGAAWVTLGLLGVLVAATGLAYGGSWGYLFPMFGIAAGVVLTGRAIMWVLAVATVVAALAVWRDGGDLEAVLAFGWGTLGAGAVVAAILQMQAAIRELNRTREQLAEAAVTEERLRIARDLHDLLGHTLSVMVVKAEATRRLLPRSPDGAAQQATDIEQLGRTALAEVRAAVTGYRGHGLAAELDSARAALTAAGVTATVHTSAVRLAPETDALLGWAVREGTTNVIRHSGARTCRIELVPAGDGLALEIEDDGVAGGEAVPGHGLEGLAERVAASGGHLAAGPGESGGFLLRVIVAAGK